MLLVEYDAKVREGLAKAMPGHEHRLAVEWAAKIRTSWACGRRVATVVKDIVKYERGEN